MKQFGAITSIVLIAAFSAAFTAYRFSNFGTSGLDSDLKLFKAWKNQF